MGGSAGALLGGADGGSRRSSGDDYDSLEDFGVPQAADVLRLCRRVTKRAGEVVSAKRGCVDDCLYVIVRGFCVGRDLSLIHI